MTIKHEIKVDKENKVLTLLVNIPRKALERDQNLSFNGSEAWEIVKNIAVEGHKVKYKRNGIKLDNCMSYNHTGTFVFPLEEVKKLKPKPTPAEPKLKTNDRKSSTKPKPSTRKPAAKKNKD